MKLLACFILTTLAAIADPLETALKEKLTALGTPGALVALTPQNGKPRFLTLGSANKTGATLPTDSHMAIGSVSKLFVGTVVLKLWEQGKLDLADPISKYVPNIPAGDAITLRMLGRHTSGLPDAIRNRDFQNAINADPKKHWSTSEILKHAFAQKPFFPPGQGWKYSNTNTILLALAAEKASGKDIASLVRELILVPLEMKHTGFTTATGLPAPNTSAYRHGRKDSPIRYGTHPYDVTGWSASWAGAAGNMHSTIHDLQRAAAPLCRGDLLGKKAKSELHDFGKTDTEGYLYGFCIESTDGLIGHSGDVPGYSSLLAYHPDRKSSLVILTNLSNTPAGDSTAKELSRVIEKQLNQTPDEIQSVE
jgi:D-alanyl-D-alanine carboxypeptidase